jgi:PAS domain S-box-containing protein
MKSLAPALNRKPADGTTSIPEDAPDKVFLLDKLSTAVLLLSPRRVILDCNRSTCFLANSSRSNLLGKVFPTPFDFMPDVSGQVEDALLRAAKGESIGLDLALRVAQQARVIRFAFRLQPSDDNQPNSILVEGYDVTAENLRNRKRAQTLALAKRERDRVVEENSERLRLAQSAARIGVWEWDPIHDFQLLSPELHRIFGTSPSDSEIPANWIEHVHPADWPRVQMLMMEGHRTGVMEFEYRYHHPTLGLRWLYCKGYRRLSETRMLGIVQDITLRKNAEVAAQRLAAIVESSDDAIVSKDLNGVVTSWNPGAERIFGYSAAEMIGQSITKIIPPNLYEDEARILATIGRGERIEHFETVRLHKSGHQIEVSLTVSPVKDQAGCIIGAAKIARDITQQKKAERDLRTTERLASVGRLAATVAHEINNPLEAVTNLIYLARLADKPETYLTMAEEELERISHLTRQTLGFYRETKAATNVHVGELVSSLLSVFTSRIRNKNVHVTSEIHDETDIDAVPGEIRQVIANLIANSIDALGSGGRIRIRVAGSTRYKDKAVPGVRVTIADNGSGIPAGVREHLFEPFFTTKKEVGTGLGLWICKSIVENHHGTIRLRSNSSPNRSGTTFSVFFPVEGVNSGTLPVPEPILRTVPDSQSLAMLRP